MAKQAKKSSAAKGRNDDRKSGKAFKKNPRPNNYGANGKTSGGYSPRRQNERAAIREVAKHLYSDTAKAE